MRIIFLIKCLILITTSLYSQEYEEYEFEDHRVIQIKVVEDSPEGGNYTSVFWRLYGATDQEAFFVGASHYDPKRFHISAMGGLGGGAVEGSILLLHDNKKINIKQSAKKEYVVGSNGTTKAYQVKIPVKKRISYGPHIAIDHVNSTYGYFKYTSLNLGASRISAKHSEWHSRYGIKGRVTKKQGSAMMKIHLDLSFMLQHNRELEPEELRSDYIRPLVPRIYIEGYTTTWGKKGVFSLNYILGAQVSYYKQSNFDFFGGFGLGLNFDVKELF